MALVLGGERSDGQRGPDQVELARARLLQRPDTALWIAAYAPAEDSRDAAERALREFAQEWAVPCSAPSADERTMTARDDRLLIAHVVYRFDVGGLENGVVNLLNRLPGSLPPRRGGDDRDHGVPPPCAA